MGSVDDEQLQHLIANLLGQLQQALELFEADVPLSETQRALVRAALVSWAALDPPLSSR